ncbi:MAG: TetR/AcrR family transcriptional regulator, partial [Actinobacteria bacterium]|nr:TetR/AcrR family transcriptional regulator [Actinomycetota bacterium]
MPKLRWGAEAPTDSDQSRERLIDAAEACFERYGVMKTTVEDVA